MNTLRARHASGENAAPVDAMHLELGIDHGERVLSPVREPADALAADIRAKLDFSRRHTAQSEMFASEAVHGGRFLTRTDRTHMQAITVEKARIFEGWMKAGKMAVVDPMHLFIMMSASTQF